MGTIAGSWFKTMNMSAATVLVVGASGATGKCRNNEEIYQRCGSGILHRYHMMILPMGGGSEVVSDLCTWAKGIRENHKM